MATAPQPHQQAWCPLLRSLREYGIALRVRVGSRADGGGLAQTQFQPPPARALPEQHGEGRRSATFLNVLRMGMPWGFSPRGWRCHTRKPQPILDLAPRGDRV